jgi:hypothetical protein
MWERGFGIALGEYAKLGCLSFCQLLCPADSWPRDDDDRGIFSFSNDPPIFPTRSPDWRSGVFYLFWDVSCADNDYW